MDKGIDLRTLFAGAALLISALALFLNWRTRRDVKLSLQPVVELLPGENISSIAVRLRSRSNIGYKVERIYLLWPFGGRIAPKPKNQKWGRSATIDLSVRHAGTTPGARMGSGDEHQSEFFFLWPKRLQFEVSPNESLIWATSQRSPSTRSANVLAVVAMKIKDQNDAATLIIRRIRLRATIKPDAESKN